MTKQRKPLLALLCITGFAFTLQISFRLFNERREELSDATHLTLELLKRMELNTVQAGFDKTRKMEVIRMYQSFPPEKELYDFGEEIKSDLLRNGFAVNRYRQLTQEGTSRMEFHAECYPYMLLSFLDAIEGARIHSLTLDVQTLPARISFQASPLTAPGNIPMELAEHLSEQEMMPQDDPQQREYPVTELAGIFPQSVPNRNSSIPVHGTNPPQEAEIQPVDRSSFQFVGIAAIDGLEKKLYFKNLRTGQVAGLSSLGIADDRGWRLVDEEETHYRIFYDDAIHEIQK